MEKKKTNPYKIFSFAIIGLLVIGLAIATTTISDSGISTPAISSNTSFSGLRYNFSVNDAIVKFFGYNSILASPTAPSGGIEFNQTRPEAKEGIWWDAYDSATGINRPVAWIVAHYNSSSGNGIHSHVSIETLDNITGTPSINSHLAITYNGSQQRAEVTFPDSDVILQDDQKVYFGEDKNASLRYSSALNRLVYSVISGMIPFDLGGNNLINVGSLTMTGNTLTMNSTGTSSLYINRGGTSNFVSLILQSANTDRWAIQMRNDAGATSNLHIRDSVNGVSLITLVPSATRPQILIDNNTLLQFQSNTTAPTCDGSHEGAIYYDGTQHKHYGCNSTEWNALY